MDENENYTTIERCNIGINQKHFDRLFRSTEVDEVSRDINK